MNSYKIDIKPSTNPTIVQFVANRFLTEHESFEFANIDEASNSPLAQQLFYLPFVKTVYIAQNFVAIQKYDMVEWKDVQQETADQISDYLNNGGPIFLQAQAKPQKIATSVYAESTPNPAVLKFVVNKKLVIGTTELKDSSEAKHSPMAQALFQFPFVKELFFDENFISVTKHEFVEWHEIDHELREFIRSYLEAGKPVIDETIPVSPTKKVSSSEENKAQVENLDATSKEIISILEEYVKPAVASDGGNIVFSSYDPESKTVRVILQGACSGCPSSTLTLKSGIETMLKEMLQGRVETVEAVNG